MPQAIELATALVSDARVGFFSFIGSAKVGWMLRSKLAAGTRCALEHGGAAPVIIDATADLNKVVPSLLKGGYYHSGQVCVSVQRVFVHERLLLEPPADCAVSSKEIFGPVVCLYAYRNIDEAIARANSLDLAFQAAVFTQDIDRAFEAYQKLDAAAVMVNDHTAFRHDAMPFAGLRHSGLAVGGIPFTIEDMQVDKLFVLKTRIKCKCFHRSSTSPCRLSAPTLKRPPPL